jgi:hypothetical protein
MLRHIKNLPSTEVGNKYLLHLLLLHQKQSIKQTNKHTYKQTNVLSRPYTVVRKSVTAVEKYLNFRTKQIRLAD